MPKNKNFTDIYLCYLTPQAKEAFDALIAAGADQDLAVTTIEAMLPEDEVYELPLDIQE